LTRGIPLGPLKSVALRVHMWGVFGPENLQRCIHDIRNKPVVGSKGILSLCDKFERATEGVLNCTLGSCVLVKL